MKKLVILAALALLVGLGGWLALPKYRQWKQDRMVARAEDDLRKGDLNSAALRARAVLAFNVSNAGATRVVAEVLERLHATYALQWWQRVVELDPDSVQDRLALARCASMDGEHTLAIKTLEGITGTNLNTVAYNEVAAMVAVGMGNLPVAERHLSEALQIDPTNREVQLNAAVIHLNATNQQVVAEATQTLVGLANDPVYRKDALRLLVMAANHAKNSVAADQYSVELAAEPQAPLTDLFIRLGVLKGQGSDQFAPMLEKLKSRCAADPNEINALTEWMLEHGMADAAAQWLDGLPTATRAKLPVEMARADCYVAQNDWAGMSKGMEDENWEEGEFLRLAMLARASREQGLDFKSQSDWLSAKQLAAERPSYLSTLIRLANKWGWNKEQEELLWLMVQKFPAEKWAMDTLEAMYLAAGNTRGLQQVNEMIVGYDAGNFAAKNNLAMVSLLLNTEVLQAYDLAAQAYAHDPKNPGFASTQAYSLYLQGRAPEALKVMASLKPEELQTPSVALYYGLILAANGHHDQAEKYFELAAAGRLLPEETELLAVARSKQ